MYAVYILFSTTTNKFYIGQTNDLNLRLIRHNDQMVKSTMNGVPWVVIWSRNVETRKEALILERKIKGRGASRFIDDQGLDKE
jgi:putative endonuclease